MKFRVWNSTEGRYYSDASLSMGGELTVEGHSIQSGDVFELSTGMLDTNGVEIYAGDIIEHPVRNRPHSSKAKHSFSRKLVYWKSCIDDKGRVLTDPGFCGQGERQKDETYWAYDWGVFFKCRVVGNVHTPGDWTES